MSGQKTEARVLEFIREHHMADGGDGVLAAVSGGADSVCLLLILAGLQKELGIRLYAFHLNHGLRGDEADRDEKFTEELCRELGILCVIAREDVAAFAESKGMSEEEAGRHLRYRHLEEEAKRLSCSHIAAAHHQDDDVETVLMNMFRGSGLKGLGGIRPVRGKIIRPLLCLRRQEIEAYLKEQGRSWCEDSTNRTEHYGRNRVRNVLLPWIREHVNSQAEKHILKVSSLAAQADEYFESQAEILLSEERRKGIPVNSIRTELLDSQPDILKSYLVRALISHAAGGQRDISSKHLEAVLALEGPGKGTGVDLPYGLKARRGYDTLTVEPWAQPPQTDSHLNFRRFPMEKGLEFPKNQYTKWFDYDKIKDTLSVRTREDGDFFLISGGKTKMLRRYMIDEKIPEEERNRIPLLAEGKHILWVIGYRISEYYKISDTTENILEVKYCKGEDHG